MQPSFNQITSIVRAISKMESPPSLVAYVNACEPVIAPASCCTHVNTSAADSVNRADT